MRFIADAMLGRLAKHLRLRGIDVLCDAAFSGNEVIRRALEDGRTILTRDQALASRPLAKACLLVRSDHLGEQMDQVLEAYPALRNTRPLTRCSRCNTFLSVVGRDSVLDLVPSHVMYHTDRFLRCDACGRTYWRGSHVVRMEAIAAKRKKAGA